MEVKIEKHTEEKILEAAKQVFLKHGYHGTRLQEIAELAGINKAMLHYYYRSKENLFEVIFKDTLNKIITIAGSMLEMEIPFEEKITQFVSNYIDILLANPFMAALFIHELNHNQDMIKNIFLNGLQKKPLKFLTQIQKAIDDGIITTIDPKQFLVNLLSLCLFPFPFKPIICMNLGLNDDEFIEFIQKRKAIIPSLLLNSTVKP